MSCEPLMFSRAGNVDRSTVELRLDVPAHEIAVLDGFCSAQSRSRAEVVREILAKWSAARVHEASLICRVAGINPLAPDAARNQHGDVRDRPTAHKKEKPAVAEHKRAFESTQKKARS